MKGTIHRHLTRTLFIFTILTVGFVISCVEVGPIPKFEYSYDFEATLTPVDESSLTAPTITIVEGIIDPQGAKDFESAISDPNQAKAYAAAVDATLNASQESYWLPLTTNAVETGIEGNDATMLSELNAAETGFLSNALLRDLIPAITAATGSSSRLSNSGRTIKLEETESTAGVSNTTQQEEEFAECRQAAQDAYDIAKSTIDSLRTVYLDQLQTRFNQQFPLIEDQRLTLEAEAQSRHNSRTTAFLTIYNNISNTIISLATSNQITAFERDMLDIANIIIYAIHYKASWDMLNSEISLIDSLITQAEGDLQANYNNLVTQVNNEYNAELTRIENLLISIQISCHNQGGVNTQ